MWITDDFTGENSKWFKADESVQSAGKHSAF